MLVSKLLVDSILPQNLKKLQNFDCENLKTISESLESNLEQLKGELNELRREKLSKFESDIKKSENFIGKINQLHVQIDIIKQDLNEQENLIKNVSQIEEYKNLIDHIEILSQTINVVQFLHQFESSLIGLKSLINEKNFTKCFDLFGELEIQLKSSPIMNPSCTGGRDNEKSLNVDEILDADSGIFILKDLKESFKVERERLWYELDLEWERLLKIHVDETKPVMSSVSVSRALDQSRLDKLTRFSPLKINQPILIDNKQVSFVFFSKLKQFCAQFLNLSIRAVINNPSLYELRYDEDAEFKSIGFVEKASQSEKQMSPIDMLETKLNQLESLFKFIYENMFSLKVTLVEWPREKERANEPLSTTSQSLMTIFSALTLKEFTRLIYEQLIINIIPVGGGQSTTTAGFDFSMEAEICNRIGDFEKKLSAIECMMSEHGAREFKSFSSSVQELYVRKKCKHVMEKGREMMMKRDLIFELVQVDSLGSDRDELLLERLREIERSNKGKQTSLDEFGLLVMSSCSISKLAKQVTDLVEETLSEAYKLMTESRENLKNVSLMCLAARNLLELYSNIIPLYYSSNLKNLPILAAIVHNDLIYLGHTCLTLYHRYKSLLANLKTVNTHELDIEYIELSDLINNFSFADLVPKLCSTGFRILNEQVHAQQANLIEYLNENPGSIRNINEADNFDLVKKSIQKCIFQVSNLSNVWFGVLNRTVYLKIIGLLFDLVCQDLLKSCLKLEDIESENSNYLHMAFLTLHAAVIEVFSKGGDAADMADETATSNIADLNAAKYVVSWNRFTYFLKILKANLIEIENMWSERKGPLSLYYEPEEIRGLIRALFMNTDRRAAVLAKIK